MLPAAFYGAILFVATINACAAAGPLENAYPRKPIRIIVPFVPDSGTDLLARAIAQPMMIAWGQPVVVDNRPGAGGIPGSELAAKAEADGYTLLLGNVAALALAPAMQKRENYVPLRDLAPVTQLASTANAMVVHPSIKLFTAEQLIAFARNNPGTLRYASGGIGTAGHLAGELLKTMTQTSMVHVPYKGSPAAMNGILVSEAQLSFTSLVSTVPHITSGRLRAIAVTSLKRVRILPAVPTLNESGVKGYEVSGWQAILVPAGTPKAIAEKLQRVISQIIHSSEVSSRMAAQGLEVVGSTPDDFGRYLKSEVSKWDTLIKKLGL